MTQRERSRRWYLKHLEEQKARASNYYREHREERLRYRREYYQKNREKILREAGERYRATREYHTKRRMSRYKELRQLIDEVKTSRGCSSCGIKGPPPVLEFHHREKSKEKKQVSLLLRFGSREEILREIEKCDVLCANCHRILHWRERQTGFSAIR